jgi:hypothetical protein
MRLRCIELARVGSDGWRPLTTLTSK